MEILCSNCGKNIPFAGNVCPYCNSNKSADQDQEVIMQITSFSGAIIGLVSGGIAYAISSIGPALIVGGLVGCTAMVFIYKGFNLTNK
jgi:RNA polymerase subunit RPABC4/transcription elongation factor Spt4